MRKWLWAVLALALLAAGGAAGLLWLGSSFNEPGPAMQTVRVDVAQGQSVRGVLRSMQSAGALASAWRTQVYLRLRGQDLVIKAGQYEVARHASAAAVIDMLEQGRVVLEQITVVEGTRFADLRRQLEANPAVRSLLRGQSDEQVMAAIGHPGE